MVFDLRGKYDDGRFFDGSFVYRNFCVILRFLLIIDWNSIIAL